ncbi:DNA polymerase III subunit delta' [uncultured Sphingomonas sp.]|uniref:DNA polymerase III subunit delta' n=1 Tax=uncultured Sphingomonas sp. TaxID=158754 RepID=UPI0025E25353|nr:DNA polymerase III subunit delta' [uncultured Sphingomonas sp.]
MNEATSAPVLYGHDDAATALLEAMRSGSLHHAWLITGPAGIGKATFARAAAARLLAESAEPGALPLQLPLPPNHRTAALLAAGAHPDYRELRRLPKKDGKDGELARSITIDQVRGLAPFLGTMASLSSRRVIVIDSADELERPGASNALLKSLEEPPAGTIFLLVSHAPGRLLPTIRSRCRVLRLEPLDHSAMRQALAQALPDADAEEIDALVRAGAGSPGRALRYAELGMAEIDDALHAIARDGDPTTSRRAKLAKALSLKAAQPRYEAFLDRVPGVIAEAAQDRRGSALAVALDAYARARDVAGAARGLSLDAGGTVLELGGLVARLAGDTPAQHGADLRRTRG